MSLICQRKVLSELGVIDVLTEHYKIKKDRMRYEEGQKEIAIAGEIYKESESKKRFNAGEGERRRTKKLRVEESQR